MKQFMYGAIASFFVVATIYLSCDLYFTLRGMKKEITQAVARTEVRTKMYGGANKEARILKENNEAEELYYH